MGARCGWNPGPWSAQHYWPQR